MDHSTGRSGIGPGGSKPHRRTCTFFVAMLDLSFLTPRSLAYLHCHTHLLVCEEAVERIQKE